MTTFTGTSGNDTFGGSSAADFYNLAAGGNDTANGGAGNDVFSMGGAFTALDRLIGGTGYDTVILNGDYSAGVTLNAATFSGIEEVDLFAGNNYRLTFNDASVAAGQTMVVNAAGLSAAFTLTLDATQDKDAFFNITGGAANDIIKLRGSSGVINAGLGNDRITITGTTGHDVINGGGGDDIINYGAAFDAADRVDGGTGYDILSLKGDYSGGVAFSPTTMANVEMVQLGAGFDYDLQPVDATVAAGQTLFIDGSALTAGDTLTVQAAGESNGNYRVEGGAAFDDIRIGDGNDVIDGNAGNDAIDAGKGNDQIDGGSGNDIITMGANFGAGDAIDGGLGADVVWIGGDYSSHVALGANSLVNVEVLAINAAGSIDLAFHDGNVAGTNTLQVYDAGALTATDHLVLDAAAETTGKYEFIVTGPEHIALTGGAGNDTFSLLSDQSFKAGDRIAGGAGFDRVDLHGDVADGFALAATAMTGVEQLLLTGDHDFNVILSDGNIAAGEMLSIADGGQTAADSVTVSAAAETDGRVSFELDGPETVDLTGGAGNDQFARKDAMTAADHLDGGAGSDSLVLDGDYAGLTLGANSLTDIEEISFAAGHNYRLATNNANVHAGSTLNVYGYALGATDHLFFDGSAEKDGSFVIDGGLGADTLIGGAKEDRIAGHGGADAIDGKAGDDTIAFATDFDAADTVDGGTGYDIVGLSGDYSAGVALGAKTLINVEQLNLTGGNFLLVTDDANVGTNKTLFVFASTTAAQHIAFDGSAETDGSFTISGGAGSDTLIGGAKNDVFSGVGGSDVLSGNGGNDTFRFVAAQIDAGDLVHGGDGVDTVRIQGALPDTLTLSGNILGEVERLSFDAFYDYSVATTDDAVGAGKVLTVEATSLTTADILVFDGSAETDGRFALTGGAANDVLTGGAGADKLTGGLGRDVLAGGAGKDVFVYGALAESDIAHADTIKDFVRGADRIDVHLLDANTATAGDDAFHFGATAGHVGDITAAFDAANNRTIVNFFTDGDAVADLRVILSGDQHLLLATDFIL